MATSTICGAGIGLRTAHVQELLSLSPQTVPWLEVLADNWLAPGGLNRRLIQTVSEQYPTVLHGVGLSLGSTMPLDMDYLQQIKQLKKDIGAAWYSEHASFSSHNGLHFPDLLPLPFTQESARHLSTRILQVQDFLGETILLENISAYLQCPDNEMNEAEFLAEVSNTADCNLLLDINNVFVSSENFSQCAEDFLNHIPLNRVRQIHLAGFEDKGDFLLDAHNNPVAPQVWQLFEAVIKKQGAIPSMIEWDHDVPPLKRLLDEQQQAQTVLDKYPRRQPNAA